MAYKNKTNPRKEKTVQCLCDYDALSKIRTKRERGRRMFCRLRLSKQKRAKTKLSKSETFAQEDCESIFKKYTFSSMKIIRMAEEMQTSNKTKWLSVIGEIYGLNVELSQYNHIFIVYRKVRLKWLCF